MKYLKKSHFAFDELTDCVNYTLKMKNFLAPWKRLIFSKFIKEMILRTNCKLPSSQCFTITIKNLWKSNLQSPRRLYGFIFKGTIIILLNTLYLYYHIVAEKSLITLISLAQFSWTSLRRMTAYPMTLLLQNMKLMV